MRSHEQRFRSGERAAPAIWPAAALATRATVAASRCKRLVPVVLAGGSGTRLWPMSREHYPKQLIDVLGSDSLLQATVRRLDGFSDLWELADSPIVVCGGEHCFIIDE